MNNEKKILDIYGNTSFSDISLKALQTGYRIFSYKEDIYFIIDAFVLDDGKLDTNIIKSTFIADDFTMPIYNASEMLQFSNHYYISNIADGVLKLGHTIFELEDSIYIISPTDPLAFENPKLKNYPILKTSLVLSDFQSHLVKYSSKNILELDFCFPGADQ